MQWWALAILQNKSEQIDSTDPITLSNASDVMHIKRRIGCL